MGTGDIAISSRRKMAALLPIKEKTAFHLYDFEQNEVIRKAKWPEGVEGKEKLLIIDKIDLFEKFFY